MVARTLSRAIRSTSLDEWSVLLRETLQNSVDARLSNSRPIHFHVTLDQATPEQRATLKEDVFKDIPSPQKHLRQAINRADLPILIIADWETRGLCGPTRADLETQERADFRDFFLNVGREESKRYQGGTFGLGRGVLFDISDNGTIVVFTRTTAEGKPVVRLMAMSIGASFAHNRLKYTGRHWWGARSDTEWPEPVAGKTAETIANSLGLDVIPEGKTGTAIMVLAPRIPEATTDADDVALTDALDEMINAARFYGWPLMVGRTGKPEVQFTFGHDGGLWEPSAPDAEDSPVRRFVEAYRIALEKSAPNGPTSWSYKGVTFGDRRAQPKPLGTLVFRHFPPIEDLPEEEDQTVIPVSAVALMRDPRMVVKYLTVSKHPLGSSTVGVFVADTAFDSQFAESEPVAHDEWLAAKIATAKFAANPVKQSLDKIKQIVKDSWKTVPEVTASTSEPDGIAPVIGDMLGGMVADTAGFGGTRIKPPSRGGGGGGAPSKSTRATVLPPLLRVGVNGAVVAAFPVEVSRIAPGSSVNLRAEARIVLDSGLEPEDERPEGASGPAVVGWQRDETDSTPLSDRDRVTIDGSVRELLVLVEQPRDTAVTVMVSASEIPA
jgi:hypothetical protein